MNAQQIAAEIQRNQIYLDLLEDEKSPSIEVIEALHAANKKLRVKGQEIGVFFV